nr:DUF4411 family protein [Leucothrix pacifica]
MYLLDANTYIQAKNSYYNMAFCPAYWDWLDQQAELRQVGSISEVYDELVCGSDELAEWVKGRRDHFIPTVSDDIQGAMGDVANYVMSLPSKTQSNIDIFLAKADPWLIASAVVEGHILVTHEVWQDPNSKKVKIPIFVIISESGI